MASWIVHLRVAEKLASQIPILNETMFAIGCIAPDAGVCEEDGETITPPPAASHYIQADTIRDPGNLTGEPWRGDLVFYREYLQPLRALPLNQDRFSFLLGYFFHLLVDNYWTLKIAWPLHERFQQQFKNHEINMWEEVQKNWFGLDRLYLSTHTDSIYYRSIQHCAYNRDDLDFMPAQVIQQRIEYIQKEYWEKAPEITLGPFLFLKPEELDQFVEETAALCMTVVQLLWLEGQDSGAKVTALELVDR